MFTRLDHVIVLVSDLEAAARDYQALLGREPAWRGGHPGGGTRNVLFSLGNGYLELLTPDGDEGLAGFLRERLEGHGEGLFSFALACENADRCVAELRERGLAPMDPVEGHGRDEHSGAERRWRNVHLAPEQTRGIMMFAIEHLSPPDALPPSPAVESESAAASEFDHIVVMTKDPDGARQFYGDGLGLRMALDKTFEKFGSRLIFFRIAGVSIEIGASLRDEVDANAKDHLWGLAYRVPDIDAARARIAGAGLDVSEVRAGRKAGTRVCTVRRPTHGVATLLIGPQT